MEISIRTIYNTENGIKEHKLGNIVLYDLHKSEIRNIDDQEYIKNYGIYFLVSQEKQKIYIGQTDSLETRLNQHNKSEDKEWFETACAITNLINFTKSEIDFLEYYYMKKIEKQSYWESDNRSIKKEPNLDKGARLELNEIIKDIDILLSFSKIDLNITKNQNNENALSNEIFSCKDTQIIYNEYGTTILKGSKIFKEINKTNNPKYDDQKESFKKLMEDWLKNKKIEIFDDEMYSLIRDIKINSPSMAGKIAKGTNAKNGWDVFKNKNGETLDQVYRKNK